MKIVIYGQARTGTTALFSRLRQALPATTRALFEPSRYGPRSQDRDVLVKMLTESLPGVHAPRLDTCRAFDHTVVTLRDPRDRLISAILFRMHWQPSPALQRRRLGREMPQRLPQDRVTFDALLTLLQRKEQDSARVPVWQLFEGLMAWQFGLTGLQARTWLQQSHQAFLACQAAHPAACVVRYEAMVQGDLLALEAALGLSLAGAAPLAPEHRLIYRTGGSGEWRQWLLAEDVTYFQDIFQDYLVRYNYPQAWALDAHPVINPATSSHYVTHWRRERWGERRDHDLS